MQSFWSGRNRIEILDTTLGDEEQTESVSFSLTEKQVIAKKLLLDLKVDRIEIASARSSAGEKDSATNIISWAKENSFLEKIEILGFVDGKKSVDWIDSCGGKVINLLCKGSENHRINQLKKNRTRAFFRHKKNNKLCQLKRTSRKHIH